MDSVRRGSQVRRETVVPDNAVYAALAAMAAVIEEPWCVVGVDELRGLVSSHSRLASALGVSADYRFSHGRAFSVLNGTLVKVAGRAPGVRLDKRRRQKLLSGLCSGRPKSGDAEVVTRPGEELLSDPGREFSVSAGLVIRDEAVTVESRGRIEDA